MQRGTTLFLKVVVLLVGLGALVGMVWFPQVEGRNANAALADIYLRDPFLAYAYLASVPFFLALYQAFRLLGYVARDRAFSPAAVAALRTIKFCAVAIIGFIAVGGVILLVFGEEDRAGVLALGLYSACAVAIVGTAVAILQRLLQRAVELQAEHDLTV